jgi:hypothetical protein
MGRPAKKLYRYRVDVIGQQRDQNFAQFEVEAESPEDAIAKVAAATGKKTLKAHPITSDSLLRGWLAHFDDRIRLALNV